MTNSRQTLTPAKLRPRASHAIAGALATLVVLAPQVHAQCPRSEHFETEYEKVTLTDTSQAGPGLAAFDGRLYLA